MPSLSSFTWEYLRYLLPVFLVLLSVYTTIYILILTRIVKILLRDRPKSLSPPRPPASNTRPTHLLIVLGSGGHTAEMLDMLRRLPFLPAKFTHRTYVVSSGDAFSAQKAKEFEVEITGSRGEQSEGRSGQAAEGGYDIVIVRRARRVHQSLFLTPVSALLCLWDCIQVLTGEHFKQLRRRSQKSSGVATKQTYPDLILTNGPGTGVCVVLASLILLFFGFSGPASSLERGGEDVADRQAAWQHAGQMRTIFVESWARVKTLSLSGKILLPLVDRFLVQWPALEGRGGGKAEFVGSLVA